MVDLGCHAGHGAYNNISDALLWLDMFGRDGGHVLGVDVFEDFALDLQHRFDNVEPYASMRDTQKRALAFALSSTDGATIDMKSTAVMHQTCCAGLWCKHWQQYEDKKHVYDHLCWLPRKRLGLADALSSEACERCRLHMV